MVTGTLGSRTREEQQRVCRDHQVAPAATLDGRKARIALATLVHIPPSGLRHRPEAGPSGSYIWARTMIREAAEFFDPLHHRHMTTHGAAPVLSLAPPPDLRFVGAPGRMDAWFDPELLQEGAT